MIVIHHPESANYAQPGHPERPSRVVRSAARLRRLAGLEWRRAEPATDEALLRAHAQGHLARLDQPEPFDADTPWHEGIGRFARLSAGAAVEAVDLACRGQAVFSLMRPPGHHCTADRAMGFCYLNNVAIAALHARANGVARVAIWDFDAHHGNGTEAIVQGREGILFASVHQHPCYPGTGMASVANRLNFPVLPMTPAREHRAELRRAWEALLAFAPELVLVSAGFDAYRGDPLTSLCLEREDFLELGAWLHEADLPAAALLEGGYSEDLPELIAAFLEGWLHG
ncbi:MAG: histone deacetylase [Verrucomicrobia bacterium]|nr:MAG: histone deacetylase [Verrucomicrobiota bacterium]